METVTLQKNTNKLRLEGIDILLETNDIEILKSLVASLKKTYKELTANSKEKPQISKDKQYPDVVNRLIGVAKYEEDYKKNYIKYLEEKNQ